MVGDRGNWGWRGSKFSGRFDFEPYPDTGVLKKDNLSLTEESNVQNHRRRHCGTDDEEDRMVMLRLRSYPVTAIW